MLDSPIQFQANLKSETTLQQGLVYFKERKLYFVLSGSATPVLVWDEFSINAVRAANSVEIASTVEKLSIFINYDPQIEALLKDQMNISIKSELSNWVKSREWVMFLYGIFGLVGVSILFLFLIRTQADRFVPLVSKEYETKYGQEAFEKNFANNKITLDGNMKIVWDGLTLRLQSLRELQPYKWNINIIQDKEVNAFALPGGVISLNTGFLIHADSAEEILGVLAHEMGHVMKRHSVKHVVREAAANFFKLFLGAGFVGVIVAQVDHVNALSYSRSQELDADTLGFRYLKKAKISPDGFKHFFTKKRPEDMLNDYKWVKWLSSHPSDEERLKNISQYSDEDSAKIPKIIFPLKEFKEALANAKAPSEQSSNY